METYGIEKLGIINTSAVYRNLAPAALTEHALRRGEGTLSNTGALVVKTGKYTGRSAKDKFIVDSAGVHDEIAWGSVNKPVSQEGFDAIYAKVVAYLQNKEVFIFDGFAGADPKYRKGFRVICELASEALFINDLLRRPTAEQLANFQEDFTVIACPGFKCIPEIDGTRSEAAIMIDYEKHLVLIAGSQYAGEIKKSVFSVMNYVLPKMGVFPMHCSANIGADGDSAVFFGLSGTGKTTLSADPDRKLIGSGTGKTTLSADPNRKLIGDDEHGWSEDSVFNFEGGCYAKCINLSAENEPEIYGAIKFGALVENVVMDPETRQFDFYDDSLAVNSRVGYPIEFINNAELSGVGAIPKTVVFLTADAYGVLPPISKLDKNQAMYYFVSGFTSKLAGTEIGVKEPVPTFSTCFGEPFLPLDPSIYAAMLAENLGTDLGKIANELSKLYPLLPEGGAITEQLVEEQIGISKDYNIFELQKAIGRRDVLMCNRIVNYFAANPKKNPIQMMLPLLYGYFLKIMLIVENTWEDKAAYEAKAKELAGKFIENFKKYTLMSEEVIAAGPKA